MKNDSEEVEVLNRIRKEIANSSQNAESLVRFKFEKLGYLTHQLFYEDYDQDKERETIRELDFSAFKQTKLETKDGSKLNY